MRTENWKKIVAGCGMVLLAAYVGGFFEIRSMLKSSAMSVCRVWYFVRKKMVNGSRGTAFGFNGTGNLAWKRQSIA